MTTTTTTTTTHALGDKVTPDRAAFPSSAAPGPYTITKVPTGARGVNYVATPDGGGRGLRGPAWAFTPATGDEATNAGTVSEYVAPPLPGAVVTVTGLDRHGIDADGLFVVLADSRKGGGSKIVRLGGSTTYFPHVPTRHMTVVDPATLTRRDA